MAWLKKKKLHRYIDKQTKGFVYKTSGHSEQNCLTDCPNWNGPSLFSAFSWDTVSSKGRKLILILYNLGMNPWVTWPPSIAMQNTHRWPVEEQPPVRPRNDSISPHLPNLFCWYDFASPCHVNKHHQTQSFQCPCADLPLWIECFCSSLRPLHFFPNSRITVNCEWKNRSQNNYESIMKFALVHAIKPRKDAWGIWLEFSTDVVYL